MKNLIAVKFGSLPAVWFVTLAVMASATPAWSGGTIAPGETLSFSEADRGEGTPYSDTPNEGKGSFWVPADGQAEAFTHLTVGAISMSSTAFGTVITDFFLTNSSSGTSTVLDATISADVEWNGILYGAGVLGAGASVTVSMALVDDTTGTTTGQVQVVSKSQDSTGLKGIDIGGTLFNDNKGVVFTGKVVRGHSHSIRLTVACASETGLLGVEIGCQFMNDAGGLGLGDRFTRWTSLSITVEQDTVELLENIQKSIDALTVKVDDLQDDVDVITERQLEDIRLQVTPLGRRATDVPACDGGACDFPNKK